MEIVRIDHTTAETVVPLIAAFRVTLSSYRGIAAEPDLPAAAEEIREFLDKGYPVYAAIEGGGCAGYLVCRIEEPCLWVEHFYVRETARRRGVGTMLFRKAEETAASMGEDTVYNYVHPNNEGMIAFLRSRGYTVLNMIEIRKPYRGETLSTTVHVEGNEFDY